jgi:hypothetical protein
MIRYTIKLTKSEVDELMSIINKGSHTSQTFRTAYILVNSKFNFPSFSQLYFPSFSQKCFTSFCFILITCFGYL